MIKKVLHKTFSFLMAFLVLFSTVSFTVETHFCGDTLIDVAVFSKLESCIIDMDSSTIRSKEEKHCCKDKLEIVKGQDKLKLSKFEDISLINHSFLTSYVYSFLGLFGSIDKEFIPNKNYSPPNLVADIQVLDQVFTI